MNEENKKKILIADDEPDILNYLKTLVQDYGFEAITAIDGEIALELAVSEKPDIISLDISMPEKSGSKALKELRENEATKEIPIIVVTGVDSRYKDFIHSRRTVKPPTAYFEKPVKPEEFIGKICELLNMEVPEKN